VLTPAAEQLLARHNTDLRRGWGWYAGWAVALGILAWAWRGAEILSLIHISEPTRLM
jgi:hypothetical protein